ncbi:MAG: tetratricopeptide repeat protein, partial [Gemmatimonadales bacterium]
DEERRIRDADIAFYQARIPRDPSGALDPVRLGALFLERYRDLGHEPDLAIAEQAARQSLANRREHNPGAWQVLTAALLGQHRFVEAKAAASALGSLDPEDGVARAILGETLLELGEYSEADRLFRALTPQRHTPGILTRYARWLELRGRSHEARALLERGREAVGARPETPLIQRAWYDLRLGELALRFGASREARRRLDAGLTLIPDHWRLLLARARLASETGELALAIRLADSSLTRKPDPVTLALLGDAWAARGDSITAKQYLRAMEAMAPAEAGGFHRAWYLALLDHDLRVPAVLAAVSREIETRKDIYGWDLLAWALYQSGRPIEARAAMEQALAWGTEDRELARHARAIEAAR